MVGLIIDLGPQQLPITKDRIQEMITWRPRRMKLNTEWPDALHPPDKPEKDWSLVLPFCETLRNSFDSMCLANTIGLREGRGGRCFTFITDTKNNGEDLEKVRQWLEKIGPYVAIRDCLALSYAIDYDREGGSPKRPQTKIGTLRSVAKTYGATPTRDTFTAANALIEACLEFIERVNCYKGVDIIVGVPPSDPNKPFNLPSYLAAGIATGLAKPDRTSAINTINPRTGLKEVVLEKKLETLEGTVAVDSNHFKAR
jgi:hypothetical protein